MVIKNKRGFEFSFSWLFALLVGAVILFLAIYATIQLISSIRLQTETEQGRQLSTLLLPVQTNLEAGKAPIISVSQETKIFNQCIYNTGSFGQQKISISLKSGIGEEWQKKPGVASTFYDRYLFSNSTSHGNDEFYILSKPFKLPFKIADIIILWSDREEYCFVNSSMPSAIQSELRNLNLKNLIFKENYNGCPVDSNIVCFSTSDRCREKDIQVYINLPLKVSKNGKTVYYEELESSDKYALLYAAIFSTPEIYECQIKRLMLKASELAGLYNLKSQYLTDMSTSGSGCSSGNIQSPLINFQARASQIAKSGSSENLGEIIRLADEIHEKNIALRCKLY
jgi:hypothetical protein